MIRTTCSTKEDFAVQVTPPISKTITCHKMKRFDSILEDVDLIHHQLDPTRCRSLNAVATGTKAAAEKQTDTSISISMPPTPSAKGVGFNDIFSQTSTPRGTTTLNKRIWSYSQTSMPRVSVFPESPKLPSTQLRNPRNNTNKLKDTRFDSFKTWSGRLERQLSVLRGKEQEPISPPSPSIETIPVNRYFDALEGPELDSLKASEEIILPEDRKWPFLLRFPISSFGICLGVSSQAIMWKKLATSASTKFLHISLKANLGLWCISAALMVIISFIYALKIIFYFEAVRREYYHPVRVNFFFAPWISLLFLALGVPTSIAQNLHTSLWYILMTPIFCLEVKLYGQWMSGGQRRLSKVANPSNHLSIVGNFVGALLGASMGLTEGPIFFFAVGLAHYIVMFVTLYQRLPTNDTLPKELHPVFFLFVAAPSVASIAWATIQGSFDQGSRIAYFIALFLYFSLAVRINFFRGFKFSLAWWAYTFPMTGAAIATIRYSLVVTNLVTKCLAIILCGLSTLTVTTLLVTTIIHAFFLGDLFPNDISIAINKRPKITQKWYLGNSDSKNIDQYLKYVDSFQAKDTESSLTYQNSSS
ncbi:S-type anion channel SLAH3 [Capsicum annuum]|nr:S-type anion channel SLAH3 [Capsicum annuum]KAF3627347.1 S-type anion channel SLAH3 [Capsicum annuum]KAF3634957.1 S-type anion channel SLAH3 [Capsicum annuum]